MALYYYLISSLPEISTTGGMPISYEEFLHSCEGVISEEKYDYLANLTLNSDEGPVLEDWGKFYRDLKGEVNYQRSAAQGRSYSTEYDKDLLNQKIAQAALSARNPLETEKMLLEYQFVEIDRIIGLHSFDDTYLFGYAIKLKLLERQDSLNKAKGETEFMKLIMGIHEDVFNL